MWRSRTFLLDLTIKVLSIFQRNARCGQRGFANKSAQKCLSWPVTQANELATWTREIKFKDYFSCGCRGNSEFLSDTWQISLSDLMLKLEHFFSLRLVWFSAGVLLINVRPALALPRLIPFSHLRRLEFIRPWNDHLRPARMHILNRDWREMT